MSARNYDSYYDVSEITKKSEKVKSSTRKKSTEPETENGIVCNAICVKVRETPSPEAKVIAVANAKEKVRIINEDGNYYKVKLSSGDEGYILSDFCKKE